MQQSVIRDLRIAGRRIVRYPLFSAIVIMTLALGIGPSSTIFSVINAVLLRPLPFKDPEELVMIWNRFPGMGELQPNFSKPEMVDLRERSQMLAEVGAWGYGMTQMTGTGSPAGIQTGWLSANLLALLGLQPALGRSFAPDEHTQGRDHVVLLHHNVWQERFGADPNVIGTTITLDDEPYEVIGVMPQNFQLPLDYQWSGQTGLFLPLLDPADTDRRQSRFLYIVGRVGESTSVKQARAEIATISSWFRQEFPDAYPAKDWELKVEALKENVVGDLKPALYVLAGTMVFVLLIVCSNLVNLFLAWMSSRETEVALSSALGASRRRLFQQLFVDCSVMTLCGGILGGLLAFWGGKSILALTPGNVPRLDEVAFGWAEVAFALVLSVITGILLGFVTVFRATRVKLNDALQGTTRGAAGSKAQNRVRRAIVIGQVAAAMILLVGAGLLVQSFRNLLAVDIGFNRNDVLAVNLRLNSGQYAEEHQAMGFFDEALRRTRALPGVESVGGVTFLPFYISPSQASFLIEGRPTPPGDAWPSAGVQSATPDYFATLQIPLIRGRQLSETDGADSAPVAVINATLARRYWGDEEAVGKRFRIADPTKPDQGLPWVEIVGVVGDVLQTRVDEQPQPQVFIPYHQTAAATGNVNRFMTMVVRGADLAIVVGPLRAAIWELDPDLPLAGRTLEDRVSMTVARPRFAMLLLSVLGGLSLILAAVGIYGIMSYLVTQRTKETGVRMALGARQGDVLRGIVREAMVMAVSGLLVGALAAFWLTRLIKSLLFGVAAADLTIFFGAALVICLSALLASFMPAWRATRIQPIEVLRYG